MFHHLIHCLGIKGQVLEDLKRLKKMTSENKEKLNKYAEVKLEIKKLEEIIEELQPEVMSIVDDAGVEEVEIGDLGKLTKAFRRTWKYAPEIEAIKKEYDTKKKEAEQTGIGAEYTEKPYLLFKTNKEDVS